MYCSAQALASTGATEHALERHNLLCLRQDYTRSNLSETITLVEWSRLAGLSARTSCGDFARAPGILLVGTSAICGLRKQRDACRNEAHDGPRVVSAPMRRREPAGNRQNDERYGVNGGKAEQAARFLSPLGVLVANASEETNALERRRR